MQVTQKEKYSLFCSNSSGPFPIQGRVSASIVLQPDAPSRVTSTRVVRWPCKIWELPQTATGWTCHPKCWLWDLGLAFVGLVLSTSISFPTSLSTCTGREESRYRSWGTYAIRREAHLGCMVEREPPVSQAGLGLHSDLPATSCGTSCQALTLSDISHVQNRICGTYLTGFF